MLIVILQVIFGIILLWIYYTCTLNFVSLPKLKFKHIIPRVNVLKKCDQIYFLREVHAFKSNKNKNWMKYNWDYYYKSCMLKKYSDPNFTREVLATLLTFCEFLKIIWKEKFCLEIEAMKIK